MRLQVMLTFGQTSGQVDIRSGVALRIRLWVRLTSGQTSGQVDIRSDVPPKLISVKCSKIFIEVH